MEEPKSCSKHKKRLIYFSSSKIDFSIILAKAYPRLVNKTFLCFKFRILLHRLAHNVFRYVSSLLSYCVQHDSSLFTGHISFLREWKSYF